MMSRKEGHCLSGNNSLFTVTVFHFYYRNVPYDVDKEDLASVFRQFGSIRYCRPVIDTNTEKCKGSAFIQYKTIDSISACIEAAKSDDVRVVDYNTSLLAIFKAERE